MERILVQLRRLHHKVLLLLFQSHKHHLRLVDLFNNHAIDLLLQRPHLQQQICWIFRRPPRRQLLRLSKRILMLLLVVPLLLLTVDHLLASFQVHRLLHLHLHPHLRLRTRDHPLVSFHLHQRLLLHSLQHPRPLNRALALFRNHQPHLVHQHLRGMMILLVLRVCPFHPHQRLHQCRWVRRNRSCLPAVRKAL